MMIPEITNFEQLDNCLNACKAIPTGEITDSDGFYKLKRQTFKFPNGTIQPREYIDKDPAAVIVPEDPDGNFIMVIQPAGLTNERALIEFPAGYVKPHEDSKTTGVREMLEETGLMTDLANITYLGYHYQDPGAIRQPVHAYLAEYCNQHYQPKPDSGEYIQLYKVSKVMFLSMLHRGYIKDANTFIAGIQALFHLGILEE